MTNGRLLKLFSVFDSKNKKTLIFSASLRYHTLGGCDTVDAQRTWSYVECNARPTVSR